MMAKLMNEVGKPVVALVEADVPDVLADLRMDNLCAVLLLYDAAAGRQNLEQALAHSASLLALVGSLRTLAVTRGYSWERQRECIVSSLQIGTPAIRDGIKVAKDLEEVMGHLEELQARNLIARLLSANSVTPFEMKGGRQGRLVAETIIAIDNAVPTPFATALHSLDRWLPNWERAKVEIPLFG
jgi:hypothetical protein